jgi:hypothetical protein
MTVSMQLLMLLLLEKE